LRPGFSCDGFNRAKPSACRNRDPCLGSGRSATSFASLTPIRRGELCNHLQPDAVVILDVFSKKTDTTPKSVMDTCRKRLAAYQRAARGKGKPDET
jgi:hypothetical protein